MFTTEKIFLFLLISICLVICIVVVDAVIDPGILIHNVYAALNSSGEQESGYVYQPELDGELVEGFSESLEGIESTIQDGWQLFRSEGYAFEIEYPKSVVQKSILNQDAINSGIGLEDQAPVWEFNLDEDAYYLGTNLVDASLLIHVLQGKEQEDLCSQFSPGSLYQTPNQLRESLPQVEINGVTFWKDEVIEGVMGEFYHRISYRTFTKGACYELTELIHYRNLSGITDQQVKDFDLDGVVGSLDEVLGTFTFLDLEPTFPEQTYPLPKTTSLAVSKATSTTVNGLDISHWQGTINWTKVANAGYKFTFAKGTEGISWTDVKFHTNMTQGTAAGVRMGAYHFARPDLGNKASDEANHFIAVAGDYLKSGYLRPVLDLEVGGSLGKTKLSAWVLEWMQTVENKTGISPLIYTNKYFIDNYLTDAVTQYDLWIAYWSCYPTPTYDIPPTGKWRDWAFWQYYGPGGCGGNAGYVPGITTDIDLNIFNGVASGLQEYDAATTQVWVSLSSDAYLVPAPYYADITGNVNGDFTGLIDFSFWWDCDALEADVAAVEGVCGALPDPAAGQCLKNDIGQRCVGMTADKQLAEHTYTEIGNYTAKVIAEVGTNPPVEDRYKISTYNPIQTITNNPKSPAEGSVNVPFALTSDVTVRTTVSGALQVSIGDPVTGELEDYDCTTVSSDVQTTKRFNLSWMESTKGSLVYEMAVRYRPQKACPILDTDADDITQLYVVNWVDDNPVLELSTVSGESLLAGSIQDLGDLEPFQIVTQGYLVSNPTEVNAFQITSIDFEDLVNVTNPAIDRTLPMEIGPGEDLPLGISFELPGTGPFSFDVLIEHDAGNPTPYLITVQGEGVFSTNPLLSISSVPASPGTASLGQAHDLLVTAELDAPAVGSLQLSLQDGDGTTIGEPFCQQVAVTGTQLFSHTFSWTESESGLANYTVWARYRPLGECPVLDVLSSDLSLDYQVDWQDDSPILEVMDYEHHPLLAGSVYDIGDQSAFTTLADDFILQNTSSATSVQVTGVEYESVVNILNPRLDPPLPIEIGPGEEIEVNFAFDVGNVGEFSMEINLEHTAANPSPFILTLQGQGLLDGNPIQAISPTPASPGQVLIGDSIQLSTAVNVDAPAAGALVLEIIDAEGEAVINPDCQVIDSPGAGSYSFSSSWTENETGLRNYTINAGYFALESCPVASAATAELSMSYQIDWQEESPILEIQTTGGSPLASGTKITLGQYEYYRDVVLEYRIHNSSRTNPLDITGIRTEDHSNIGAVNLNPEDPQTIGPEESILLEISFRVENTGDFSFELVLEHLASNPSPYLLTFQGSGVMTDNPIKFVVPTPPSPGSALIGETFPLRVDVGIAVPDQGALQVDLVDSGSGVPIAKECQALSDNLNQARTFNLSWTSQAVGSQEIGLTARYRAQGDCPVQDSQESDLSQTYVMNWEEETPILEVRDESDSLLIAGGYIDLGPSEFFQEVELFYTLRNPSSTTALHVNSLRGVDLVNLEQVDISPSGPFTLQPGGQQTIRVAFLVTGLGQFGMDVEIEHDGGNSSPYLITFGGSGMMSADPIQALLVDPPSPGSEMITEPYQLEISVNLDLPAEGALEISLENQASRAIMDQTCLLVPDGVSTQMAEFTWEELSAGESGYTIRARYQALGLCPLEDEADAELTESYQVVWGIQSPELVVNRPEGVTIFDGAVDYVGVHDFFRFVEVTYVIENNAASSPLVVESITPENLVNLREVLVEPSEAFEVGPGESQVVKVNFQVLMLEPFSFDLIWEHNGANPSPYRTTIQGGAALNLGEIPVRSWLYRFLEAVIRSGFFLKLPIFGSSLLFWMKRTRIS